MNIIYPINGKNERMGSLFTTPKHLLLREGKQLIVKSVQTIKNTFPNDQIFLLTNDRYYNDLKNLFNDTVKILKIDETSSQIETIKKITTDLVGSVMFIDCDIDPIKITNFNKKYATVFTFINKTKLLNYSNFKTNRNQFIIECNEKRKLHKYAGAGIYYFPDVDVFNNFSKECKNISECINEMIKNGFKCKINSNSEIDRFGTLQDIYVDDFSFRRTSQKNLNTGFTNNKVTRYSNRVTKIGELVHLENEWYKSYKNKKHIPKIISYKNNSIVLEYINRDNDFNIDDIFDIVEEYKQYDKLNNIEFDSYIDNIVNHLQKNNQITNGDKLISKLKSLNIKSSFCHGDLSVMNMIPTVNGIKLIDPLYSKIKFGSYEIDLAKLSFSFKFYKNDSASFNYVKQKANISYLDILIASESVRVATYRKEYSFISENLINEL